ASSMPGHQRATSGAEPSSAIRGTSSGPSGRSMTRGPRRVGSCIPPFHHGSAPPKADSFAVGETGLMKKRLDMLLVERGLAESRAQAQALVLAGRVPGYTKPGTALDETAELSVEGAPRF